MHFLNRHKEQRANDELPQGSSNPEEKINIIWLPSGAVFEFSFCDDPTRHDIEFMIEILDLYKSTLINTEDPKVDHKEE